MSKSIVGIDISKLKFDIALLTPDNKVKTKVFQNNIEGYESLIAWVSERAHGEFHFCMEATGIYGDALACYLYDAGYIVSVVNPAQIKGHALSELAKIKSDKADAKLIARFCSRMNPAPWKPKPQHVRQLQALVNRLDAVQSLKQQEENRLLVAVNPAVINSIESVIKMLEEQITELEKRIKQQIKDHDDLNSNDKLLQSIPGIGEKTAAKVLAFLGNIEEFASAKHMAAFVGLSPKQHSSGSSVKKRTHLSKMGNAHLRKAFYMPALVAIRFNPLIKTFSDRLKCSGKSSMAVIGAVMRKLVHLVYGILKAKKPFDAAHGLNCA